MLLVLFCSVRTNTCLLSQPKRSRTQSHPNKQTPTGALLSASVHAAQTIERAQTQSLKVSLRNARNLQRKKYLTSRITDTRFNTTLARSDPQQEPSWLHDLRGLGYHAGKYILGTRACIYRNARSSCSQARRCCMHAQSDLSVTRAHSNIIFARSIRSTGAQ
jgi:hypothetical protein